MGPEFLLLQSCNFPGGEKYLAFGYSYVRSSGRHMVALECLRGGYKGKFVSFQPPASSLQGSQSDSGGYVLTPPRMALAVLTPFECPRTVRAFVYPQIAIHLGHSLKTPDSIEISQKTGRSDRKHSGKQTTRSRPSA